MANVINETVYLKTLPVTFTWSEDRETALQHTPKKSVKQQQLPLYNFPGSFQQMALSAFKPSHNPEYPLVSELSNKAIWLSM